MYTTKGKTKKYMDFVYVWFYISEIKGMHWWVKKIKTESKNSEGVARTSKEKECHLFTTAFHFPSDLCLVRQACQHSTVKWNILARFWHLWPNGAVSSCWAEKTSDIANTHTHTHTVQVHCSVRGYDRRTGPIMECDGSVWLSLEILSFKQSLNYLWRKPPCSLPCPYFSLFTFTS